MVMVGLMLKLFSQSTTSATNTLETTSTEATKATILRKPPHSPRCRASAKAENTSPMEPTAPKPVSYTHLDVYKRQGR